MPVENELFVLPFDHRGSFLEEMFGVRGVPTEQDVARVEEFKWIVYQGFKLAMQRGVVPKRSAAILVDEQFGARIIEDAKREGYRFCVSAEKSGQKEFTLEYGDEFQAHIERFQPEFVKALIRYNPDEDAELNEKQAATLKVLSDYCRKGGYKLMLEPLVPATPRQLAMLDGDQEAYDVEMRPQLMELMMEELQEAGVEPSVWKIEGLEYAEDYVALVEQAHAGGRQADIIILGRHASDEQVDTWLEEGAGVPGVVGFAVGRTIFWPALTDYKAKRITAEAAAERIAERFEHFYRVFRGE